MEKEELEKYNKIKRLGEDFSLALQDFKEIIAKEQDQVVELTQTMIEETRFSQYDYDPELFKEYLREPYVIFPVEKEVWGVAVPKYVQISVGFFWYSTNTHNVFKVDRMTSYFGEIPKALADRLKFKDSLPLKIFDGLLLTGIEHQDEAWTRYRKHLSRKEGSDIKIKRGHEFDLQGKLLNDGILPYFIQPVSKELLREPEVDFTLFDFQKEGKQTFLEKGSTGFYWAMGSGKTFVTMDIIASIKGPKLVIVPTATLIHQWRNRLKKHTKVEHEVEVVTYQLLTHATSKRAESIKNKEYSLVVFDEAHWLPANNYKKLALLKTRHRIGLSATPFREDKNSWLIIALTGYPVGMNWDVLFAMGIVKKPDITLYLGRSFQDKKQKLEELLKIPIKTVVFCDSIDLGKRLSKQFGYPFVHGETSPKERIDIIDSASVCFVSRVGDQGLSLDIPRVIEIDFHAGSRRQEIQRTGRTMHRTEKGEHNILMTYKEHDSYHKRIDALEGKGLRVRKVSIN
ncbi:MAG: DEAD/DEAH box helicase family protein [Candidatus Heimdallarchaeota archaeon]|nr:DEAD/DEAH box helicase family protein [Candidatus Heimdallarchaeota archaeon]MCK4610576.1 DEAD/DEAH box helicase family protein [Candidatus Heimdallarchaeota archaeon]